MLIVYLSMKYVMIVSILRELIFFFNMRVIFIVVCMYFSYVYLFVFYNKR